MWSNSIKISTIEINSDQNKTFVSSDVQNEEYQESLQIFEKRYGNAEFVKKAAKIGK